MNPNLVNHPSWEPAFAYKDKERYAQQLQVIANKKEHEYLMVENGSIRVVGRIMAFLQTIKGWFGFKNNVHPINVNYQILKMLRYGEETHHYLEKEDIKTLLGQVRNTLFRQSQYADVATFIQQTFLSPTADLTPERLRTSLDREIKGYYDRNSPRLLSNGFWARLPNNAAAVNYNLGRIKAAEGIEEGSSVKLNEAVEKIQLALAHDPHNAERQFYLSRVYQELADLQFTESSYASAKRSCDNCIAHLIKIPKVDDEDLSLDIRDLLQRALTIQFAIAIKENNQPEMLELLSKARGALGISSAALLDGYYNFIMVAHPEEFTGYKELGDLYLSIAKKEKDLASSTQIFSKAIDYLELAYREASHSIADPEMLREPLKSLFKLQYELTKRHQGIGQWPEAQHSLEKALHHFENYKATSSRVDLEPPVEEIFELAEQFTKGRDFSLALKCYEMAKSPSCIDLAKKLHGEDTIDREVLSCQIALGEEAASNGEYTKAIVHFDKAGKMEKVRPEEARRIADGLVSLGDVLIGSNDETERNIAFRCYNSALPVMKQDPDRAEKLVSTLIKMAEASRQTRINDAIGFLEVAVQNAPQQLEIYGKLADCYKTERLWAKAEQCLRNWLEQSAPLSPSQTAIEDAYRDIADYCNRQSKFLQAADALSMAARIGSNQINYQEGIYQNLMAHAGQLIQDKKEREALDCYEGLLKKFPANAIQISTELLKLGRALEDSGDKTSAIRAYESASPYLSQIFFNQPLKQREVFLKVAQDAREHANWGKAVQFYQSLLKLNTRDLNIILPLVDCLTALPDFPQAEQLIDESLLKYPGNDELIYRSAVLSKTMGLNESAIRKLNQVVQMAPTKNNYLEQLNQLEMETADAYIRNGTSNSGNIYANTSQLVSDIAPPTNMRYSQFMFISQDVQEALSPATTRLKSTFRPLLRLAGFKTPYEQLIGCRSKPRSISRIKSNGLLAANLIETAYDGSPGHKDHAEMPPELSYRIKKLQSMSNNALRYYADLQNSGKRLAESLQKSGIPNVDGWENIELTDELSNSQQIVNQATKVLLRFDTADSEGRMPPMIKEQGELLRILLNHKESLKIAITHYLNIYQRSANQYGEHCNKLIEALVEEGQYAEAIKWFETFYNKFPDNRNSLYIDSKAYAAFFIDLKLSKGKLSPEDIAVISEAAERFPNDQTLQNLPFFLFE